MKSRVKGDFHARFCGKVKAKFLCLTRLWAITRHQSKLEDMILSITALLFAFTIAFGRQTAVIGKVKIALWFFSNFETKRIIFTIISLAFGILSLLQNENSTGLNWLFIITILLILFSFFFDMKYFFPEVNKVEKNKPVNISPQLQVIGVKIENICVAYPLNEVVIPRHIINDRINENSILISYCALCQSALAFKSKIDNKDLYFKVAGVWRRNMIIYDTETFSLWQQATGECIYGKKKGQQLELISGENTTLEEWKNKHPETLFATKCTEARKGYFSRESMLKMLNKVTPKVLMPGYSDLSELPARETVFGVNYNGISTAYPMLEVLGMNKFEDKYNGKLITLYYNSDANYLTAYETETLKELIVEKQWWLGWKEFHPETIIWKKSI